MSEQSTSTAKPIGIDRPRTTLLASPAVAKLLLELQAQIIQEAPEWYPTQPADPMGDLQAPITRFDWDDTIRFAAANGSDDLTRRRYCPASWLDGSVPWHPSHWRLYKTRVDSAGQRWEPLGSSSVHVMDDFGTLVSVEGAQ